MNTAERVIAEAIGNREAAVRAVAALRLSPRALEDLAPDELACEGCIDRAEKAEKKADALADIVYAMQNYMDAKSTYWNFGGPDNWKAMSDAGQALSAAKSTLQEILGND